MDVPDFLCLAESVLEWAIFLRCRLGEVVPDRRGLATGLAIMGFGFASLIFAPTMNALMAAYDPATMFLILGAVYLVLMLSAASYLTPPPKTGLPLVSKKSGIWQGAGGSCRNRQRGDQNRSFLLSMADVVY